MSNDNDNGLSLAEWRAQRIEAVVLPSGLAMKLRRVSLMDLAAQGTLPPALLSMVEEAQEKGESMRFKIADFQKFGGSVDAFVLACAVEPAVIDDRRESEAMQEAPDLNNAVLLSELPFTDRQFIFSWANEGVADFQKFRQEQG